MKSDPASTNNAAPASRATIIRGALKVTVQALPGENVWVQSTGSGLKIEIQSGPGISPQPQTAIPRAKPARPARRMQPKPPRDFSAFPPASQKRALLRKRMMEEYFASIAIAGTTKSQAERNARALWTREGGGTVGGDSIRRWARIIRNAGGMEKAPLTTFLDHKSCEHPAARKHSKP
jgi:hypothetical protein